MRRISVKVFAACLFLGTIICLVSGQTRSCTNTRSIFDSLRVLDANGHTARPTGVIFEQLKSGQLILNDVAVRD